MTFTLTQIDILVNSRIRGVSKDSTSHYMTNNKGLKSAAKSFNTGGHNQLNFTIKGKSNSYKNNSLNKNI